MRFLSPLILFAAILVSGLGTRGTIDRAHTADRAPASSEKAISVIPTKEIESTGKRPPIGETLWPNAGERWIYRFERKASAEFAGKAWLNLKLGGRAAVEAVDSGAGARHGENRFYFLSFEVDRLEMQGQALNETRTFPSVRVEVDAAGKVRELRFAAAREGKTVSEEESDLVRDLASQWLFFENRSRMGLAEIEWTTAGAENGADGMRTVSKHVLKYPGRPEISKLDSNHEWAAGAAPSPGLKVDRIEGVENFALASPSGSFVQATSYRWVWISTEMRKEALKFAVGAPFTIEGEASHREVEGTAKVDPSRIAREWGTLKALAPHARLKLFRDAKRALDAGSSQLISLILADIRGKATASLEWRTGVGALASSSNPEAAKALLALYREQGRTSEEKLSILSGVAAGEGAPAPEWKETFEAALEKTPSNPVSSTTPPKTTAEIATFDPSRDYDADAAVREASLYALGSSIRKETDTERRRGLESVLWREVKEARTESAQATVLEAIGNSGSGAYYAYVTDQFTSGSPRVRVKAVAAVRFLASDLAKPILDRAKADPVPAVRKVALWSEKFQATAEPAPQE